MAASFADQKPINSLTRAHCAQMFFVYTGRANRRVNVLDLIRKTGLADRNFVLIRDRYAANYTSGVSPELPDFDALLEWHEDHLARHPHVEDIYMVGPSSGGYGAMIFGYLLKARKVLALAPRTAQLETSARTKAFLKDLMSVGNGVTEYCIHYAPSNRRDREYAEYFRDTPGVVLCPYLLPMTESSDHAIMAEFLKTGYLKELLPAYRAAGSAGPGKGTS